MECHFYSQAATAHNQIVLIFLPQNSQSCTVIIYIYLPKIKRNKQTFKEIKANVTSRCETRIAACSSNTCIKLFKIVK